MENSIHTVAKTIARRADWSLSNLELNKLAFMSHMMRLGENEGRAGLVNNVFEAWDYGPVSPSLYHKAKSFGSKAVGNIFHQYDVITDEEDLATVHGVVDAMSGRKPGELVAITHWEDGAWYKNYQPGVKGIVIPDSDILEEYRKRAGLKAT